MPIDDLLNASQFLTEPVAQEQEPDLTRDRIDALNKFSEALTADIESETAEREDVIDRRLPDTLNFAGIETGIPLSKEAASFLVGMGDGMLDTIHGIQQLMGREDTQRDLAADQARINELYNDPRYGSTARVGQAGGFFADPLGVIIPVGKGKSLWEVTKIGAATGTAFAGLGYVDESQGQTRVGNALIGTVTGGVLSPTLFAAARAPKALGGKIQEKSAQMLLNTYRKTFNKYIVEGANPQQATRFSMARLGWTDDDKARLILASGRPFEIKQSDFTREAAERNLLAMQSRPVRAINDLARTRPWAKGLLDVGRSVGEGVKKGIVPLSTRIAKIDKDIGVNLIKMESRIHKVQHEMQQDMKDFLDMMRRAEANPGLGAKLQANLFSGDMGEARKTWKSIFGSGKESLVPFDKMRSLMKTLYKEQKGVGYNIPELPDYFPRRVKDFDGLARFEDRGLSQEIQLFKQRNRRHPSDKELDAMIRRIQDPRRFDTAKTGSSLRKRDIEQLTEEHIQFYEPAHRSLYSYINDAVTDIERAKFFRNQGVNPKHFDIEGVDLDGDQGLLSQLMKRGERSGKYLNGEVQDLADMLRSRFTKGEMAPGEAISAFKNMTYIATLGNFKSALTQFGDVAWSAHKNGIINTAAAWFQGLPGLTKGPNWSPRSSEFVTKAQIGLDDAMQEFADSTSSKRWLDKVLSVTKFTAMDRLGKETFINANLRKVRKALKDPKRSSVERQRLRRKWNPVFGNETDDMLNDLRDGRFSDNVQVYLFDSLAEVQPIALSEMPQAYLNHPNGRLFYMLRSFTIKQLDLMRREILDNAAAGDYKKAGENFLSLGSLFVLANGTADMAKDFMSGNEVEMEDTMIDNIWKLLGLNRYTGDRVLGGSPGQAVVDMIAPPLTVYDRLLAVDSTHKLWEASPFNGLQIFDKMINDGELTRDTASAASSQRGMFHDSWDGE